ncbi:ABC transporter substrate-binding protein [Permianibacter sp. IMCC34836]|uniref:substrate-binding periplasmic protein n=1 Tax=Permianibacter fluminis TaxID=2738515 RepID=UPI0015563516|nr:transporter substrate-binding domain-containing protein [Permianibacter fluminis]NQD35520.1 ABC transporter substrate-binding protein [Permianibacter fluminis]
MKQSDNRMGEATLPPARKAVLLSALLTFAAFIPVPAGSATAAAPLEIFVEDNADPFSRPDGSGYANDIVRAAFAAAGVDITLVVVPYSRCKKQVIEGSAVACFSMSAAPELVGQVKFADTPLFSVTPTYFENRKRPLKARSEAELGAGVTIGVVREYEYPATTLAAQARGAIFDAHRAEQTNLKMLAAGRLDAALVMTNDLTGDDYWPHAAGVSNKVSVAFHSPSIQIAYLGFSTVHPQGEWALAQYNLGVSRISDNGTLASIRQRWLTPK